MFNMLSSIGDKIKVGIDNKGLKHSSSKKLLSNEM